LIPLLLSNIGMNAPTKHGMEIEPFFASNLAAPREGVSIGVRGTQGSRDLQNTEDGKRSTAGGFEEKRDIRKDPHRGMARKGGMGGPEAGELNNNAG